MHFDFVDIGTCDFDTSLNFLTEGKNYQILLVEPLEYYLDKLPNHPNVIKDNVAISDKEETSEVFYLPEETIIEYKFRFWTRGCSTIGERHPTIEHMLNELKLPLDLIKTKPVQVITFDSLCKKHNIESIGSLKIDTEGHEKFILPGVLQKIKEGLPITKIKFEHPYITDRLLLAEFVIEFEKLNYFFAEKTKMDYTFTKI